MREIKRASFFNFDRTFGALRDQGKQNPALYSPDYESTHAFLSPTPCNVFHMLDRDRPEELERGEG